MTQQPRTATGWTMRERLARLGTSRTETPELAPLMKRLRQRGDRADLSVVERAYSVAARAHEGQFRKSGDPYITHPVAVAQVLAERLRTSDLLARLGGDEFAVLCPEPDARGAARGQSCAGSATASRRPSPATRSTAGPRRR